MIKLYTFGDDPTDYIFHKDEESAKKEFMEMVGVVSEDEWEDEYSFQGPVEDPGKYTFSFDDFYDEKSPKFTGTEIIEKMEKEELETPQIFSSEY